MEFYQSIIQLLKECKLNVLEKFVKTQMTTHPEYPSLNSFTDTADEMGLEYITLKVTDKSKYDQLNYPLLAHVLIGENAYDFQLIKSVETFKSNNAYYYALWDGIVIMIQDIKWIPSAEYLTFKKEESLLSRYYTIGLISIMLILLIGNIYNFQFLNIIMIILFCTGIFVCTNITFPTINKEYNLANKFCSANDSGCNKVLDTKISFLPNYLSLGDVGIIYFSTITTFLGISIFLIPFENIAGLLLITTSLASILSLVSIYYQWRIINTWCKLCLLVIGIIWLQEFLLLSFLDKVIINPLYAFLLAIILAGVLLLWIILKLLITKLTELSYDKLELLRFKREPNLFLSQLYKQKHTKIIKWDNEIIAGNPSAPIQVTILGNVNCGPCKLAHKKLSTLIKYNKTLVAVRFRFFANIDKVESDQTIKTLNLFHALLHRPAETPQIEIIDNWFKLDNINKFKTIYNSQVSSKEAISLVKQHADWCNNMKITQTPTIFINGYQLMSNYNLSDLNLLIKPLADIINDVK